MTSFYHWLVQQGFWHYVIGCSVGAVIARIMTVRFIRVFRHLLHDFRKFVDLLDTTTPGGMKDVVDAIEKQQDADSKAS